VRSELIVERVKKVPPVDASLRVIHGA
jgi:hypothetical protein